LATFLGFAVGVARLSSNWVVRTLSATYVEVIRNVPLLLQLLIWYNAVLKPLPNPRESISIPFFNFAMPDIVTFLLGAALAIAGFFIARWSDRMEGSALARTIARFGGWLLALVGVLILLFRSGLIGLVGGVFALNNRGLYVPDPTWLPGAGLVFGLFVLGILGSLAFRWWARQQQAKTGQQYPVGLAALISIVVIPTVAFLLLGKPVQFAYPQLQGFNLRGGIQIFPEFVALLVGLVTYTAAFIAEIVRAGIVSVSKGQSEAAHALGLRPGPTLKLVIIPQAMRVIIPPLTSNYLNLTKNSSLAVAVGYPDLVQVFMGTVLNQTGQAIEVIAITMLVYLTISLATATFMNWYNARKALVER
ncbi:MAG: amino acid ABC transporter permease, partial [Beijerinckiaceae bacterium]